MPMKFKRRQALWGGLGASVATIMGRNTLKQRAAEAEQAALEALYDPQDLVQQAYQADLESTQKLATGQTPVNLQSPTQPYNRDWSKQLIVAAKLATLQYFQGKYQADYDGQIDQLLFYPEAGFGAFQQVASFKALEQAQERIRFEVPLAELMAEAEDAPSLQRRLERTKHAIEQQVEQAVQIDQTVSVYYGFLLTSEAFNLLMFRGTQRRLEILGDLLTLQRSYVNPLTDEPLGQVHLGFHTLYFKQLAEAVRAAVQTLDPAKPLVISGHSLGGALANLAAMDMALHYPDFQPNLHIYTYGTPRVGDLTFVENHSKLLPNHYRVVNLADMVPMTPLSNLLIVNFMHAGEQWSFLSHHGDIAPNHLIDVYRNAIGQQAEIPNNGQFVNLPLDLRQG
ncbi:lipase family protein [Phormidium sp. FACHB-1136]|uniref:lipase family protein n=1 Tax=Phormidium sp. FACHB-1136 TaxID=2692848 RepID=UPI001681F1CE|nr:lipase family protein [Phormidium sp. FACHB-1136]MBD2425090.1 lipase family protein [Phormidium sp. FACHB-1136]